MLEELFGGGHSSPPANSNNTQPTTQPSSPPPASEPTSGTTERVEDETAEDDMVTDHDDGTYSPAPVTDESASEEVDGEAPADEPVATAPVSADEGTETEAPAQTAPPVTTAPSEGDAADETDGETENVSPSPVATAPLQPAPSNNDATEPTQPEAAVDDIAAAPAVTKANPVTRITDLIASYEKLLSEPAADENEEARTRAMELAQNSVLTNLIDNLSASDAQAVRTPLDDDTATDQVSLITKYYAEAGR